MSRLRIVFMGTGDIALPSFFTLLDKGLVALVTQPDKPVGRKQILTPPRIKEEAIARGIPVMQPENASDPSFLTELSELKPDLIVVMAYGQILPLTLINLPPLGCINLHASLLPRYRGAACIQAAIDAGDSHSGITVMHVVKALDAGDIILKKRIAIEKNETGGSLHDRLAELAPLALTEALEKFESGNAPRTPQDRTLVSYIPKLMREDGEIDWSMSAAALERRIRAYDPWPGTSTSFTDKKGRSRRLKIFHPVRVCDEAGRPGEVLESGDALLIACGEGSLEIENIQPDGARRMKAADFMLGSPLAEGEYLGKV